MVMEEDEREAVMEGCRGRGGEGEARAGLHRLG